MSKSIWIWVGVAVSPEDHKELLTELRIATANEDMSLEKDKSNSFDLLDSFRLAVSFAGIKYHTL
jgi:hypothetical protein